MSRRWGLSAARDIVSAPVVRSGLPYRELSCRGAHMQFEERLSYEEPAVVEYHCETPCNLTPCSCALSKLRLLACRRLAPFGHKTALLSPVRCIPGV